MCFVVLKQVHAAMGRASTRVDVDSIVCIIYICEERAVDERMHRAFIVEENPVWVQVSGVVIHVVRDLAKSRAWHGIGVVVVFVVGLGVVLCLFVAL